MSSLIDHLADSQWISVSEGTDGTASSVTWTPTASTTINRIFLQNHNFKDYQIYYNGTESNTFTPAINITDGSGSHSYHEVSNQAVTSLTVKATKTLVANSEKALGEFFVGTEQFEATNNPADYSPIEVKRGYDLEMSDGGVRSIWQGQKYKADLHFEFIGTTEIASYKSLYDAHRNFYFMPTPTTGTAWDGDSWDVNWVGNYDALKLTGGIAKSVGYDVNMSLWEVTG